MSTAAVCCVSGAVYRRTGAVLPENPVRDAAAVRRSSESLFSSFSSRMKLHQFVAFSAVFIQTLEARAASGVCFASVLRLFCFFTRSQAESLQVGSCFSLIPQRGVARPDPGDLHNRPHGAAQRRVQLQTLPRQPPTLTWTRTRTWT